MEFLTVHETPMSEACPRLDASGMHFPNANQQSTIIARSEAGRLNPSLRNDSIVDWGDAVVTLAAAAVFELIREGHAEVPFGFGGADNPDLANAIADLAVTGEAQYADLVAKAVAESDATGATPGDALRALVRARIETQTTRLGATLRVAADSDAVNTAVAAVVGRASAVAWALNGPAAHRDTARDALGGIATNAERDPPRRPVNAAQSRWPVADVVIQLPATDGPIPFRVRYAVMGGEDADAEVDTGHRLPVTTRPPRIDPEAEVFVFMHGHSSRLEEGEGFYESLRDEAARAYYPKPVVMIAMDFPSNGYSQYIDHDVLMPLESTTHYVPDRPRERRFGILELYERFVCTFVEALDAAMVADGQRGIVDRVAAAIGGSMGGNLALRLSEGLASSPWWMRTAVSWSPASAYESFGNKDYFIPSPGEEFDPIGKEALERAFDRCQEDEGGDRRERFMALQLEGERLINDGTPEFEVATRAIGVLFQPLIAGLAPFLPGVGGLVGPLASGLTGPVIFGSVVLEGFAGHIALRQSDTWLRAECRAGYNQNLAVAAATLELHERYSAIRRRTHWRVAYEQLLFSHQDEVALSRGVPCYRLATKPLLLIAGGDDTVDRTTGFDIVGGVRYMAPRMRQNDRGRAIVIENTGHSIHAERPRWLATQIFDFLLSLRPEEVVALSRAPGGRISRLHFQSIRRWLDADRAIEETLARRVSQLYYRAPDGERKYIHARRFLATAPNDDPGDNLRALPATRLPLLPYSEMTGRFGPDTGFIVTHIRLRSTGPEPWNTWVSHLCNDAERLQIPTAEAEHRILRNGARYALIHDGEEVPLRVVQYLHSAPDDDPDDNLSSLPTIEE